MRDSSLKVPPGVSGIVIDARIFSRKGTERDERAKVIEDQERAKLERTRDEEVKILRQSFFRKIKRVLSGKTTSGKLVDDKQKVLLAKGVVIDEAALEEIPQKYWGEIPVEGQEQTEIQGLLSNLETMVRGREEHYNEKIDRLSRGDELPRASSRW